MSDVSGLEQAYKDRKDEWVKKRDAFEKRVQEKGAHALNTFPKVAALARGGSYRQNGYFYVKGKRPRRKTYDKSLTELGAGLRKAGKRSQEGAAAGSAEHAALYKFDVSRAITGGRQYNFMTTYMPYRNEAHHLLPVEAVPGSFAGKLKLLQKLPYNINHGENIIFLPKNTADTSIHKLPQHSGSHPDYNALVKTDLSKLQSQLTAKEEEECKPEQPPPIGVLDKMIALEERYWKFLVGKGPMNVNKRSASPDPPE